MQFAGHMRPVGHVLETPELEDLYRYIIHDSKLEEIASTNKGTLL